MSMPAVTSPALKSPQPAPGLPQAELSPVLAVQCPPPFGRPEPGLAANRQKSAEPPAGLPFAAAKAEPARPLPALARPATAAASDVRPVGPAAYYLSARRSRLSYARPKAY